MRKSRIVIVIFAVLFFSTASMGSVFAQAKAKKKSASASAIPSTTRAKVLGKEGPVVYVVDPNNPPELTALSAEKAVLKALSKTCAFGDVYSDFSFSFNKLNFKRHSGSYSKEEHFIPIASISAEVRGTDFRKIGYMYYVHDPHTGTETLLARHGMARYGIRYDDHVLAWKNLEDARLFLDAVYVLKLAKEGKECFNYLARGSKRLAAADTDGALADVLAYIQENPKFSMLFDEQNALKIYDLCGGGDCRGALESSLTEAANAEKAGDAVEAFRAYARAYTFMQKKDERTANVKNKLVALYSKLPEKPGLPETCRRLMVQAEAQMKESRYRSAVSLLEDLLEIAPWWPEGYYNIALLCVQTSVSKTGNLIITVEPMAKDYQKAIDHMKIYLTLEPESKKARAGQDKIYEWEMKAGN